MQKTGPGSRWHLLAPAVCWPSASACRLCRPWRAAADGQRTACCIGAGMALEACVPGHDDNEGVRPQGRKFHGHSQVKVVLVGAGGLRTLQPKVGVQQRVDPGAARGALCQQAVPAACTAALRRWALCERRAGRWPDRSTTCAGPLPGGRSPGGMHLLASLAHLVMAGREPAENCSQWPPAAACCTIAAVCCTWPSRDACSKLMQLSTGSPPGAGHACASASEVTLRIQGLSPRPGCSSAPACRTCCRPARRHAGRLRLLAHHSVRQCSSSPVSGLSAAPRELRLL